MSDGTEQVKHEVEEYAEEKIDDAKRYVEEKFAEAEAKASAFAEEPKPRWYAVAAFVGGLAVGVVGTLLLQAAQ